MNCKGRIGPFDYFRICEEVISVAQEFVLTKKGKIELEEELEYLKTTRRSEISEQIKEARSFGDLSENAEYTEARNEQSRVEGRIQELENTLRLATIVDDDEVNLEKVGIGTKVRLLDIEFQEEETYTGDGPYGNQCRQSCDLQ